MATKTIYVKDEDAPIWDRAKDLVGESLSQFLTNYLKNYVASREANQTGKERIVVRFIENEIPHAQAFYGRWLIPIKHAHDMKNAKLVNGEMGSDHYAAAITAKNKIAIFKFFALLPPITDTEKFLAGKLYVYDSLDQAFDAGVPSKVIAAIKTKMGVEVEELDI